MPAGRLPGDRTRSQVRVLRATFPSVSTVTAGLRQSLLATVVALGGGMTLIHASAFAATPEERTLSAGTPADADPKPEWLIVNGTAITVRQAPWQTYVRSTIGSRTSACGGSIYDATHVITAAHCVFTDENLPRPPDSFSVTAGLSNLQTAAPGDAPQTRAVTAVRSHPLFDPVVGPGSPDDVAVLQLATPLTLGVPTAQPIAVSRGGSPVQGSIAGITGFGRQVPGEAPNGQLYGMNAGLIDPRRCGGPSNALFLCSTSATASACQGDSGGPMTIGSPASLVGVLSFGPNACRPGSVNGYTNATAREISDFIAGSDNPPLAPRGGTDVSARGIFRVGDTVTCSPGSWSNNPTFAYAFVSPGTGTALQFGPSPSYRFKPGDVGRTVACQVAATTVGGTGIARTETSPPIAAPPPAPRLALSIKPSKRRIRSGGSVSFAIRVSNRGTATASRVVVCDRPGRGLAFRGTPRGARRSKGRACWRIRSLRPKSGRALRVRMRARHTNRTRTRTNTVVARAGNARQLRRATARVVVRGA